jgi:hypothetical protein
MKARAGLLGLLLCLFASLAGAAELDTVLERLKNTAGTVETLRCTFVQEKHLAMFSEVLASHGRFSFQKPGRLRWEYDQPIRMGFVIDGDQGRRWNSLAEKEQRFQLEDSLEMRIAAEQLLVWTELDLEKLKRCYDIELAARNQPTIACLENRNGFHGRNSASLRGVLMCGSEKRRRVLSPPVSKMATSVTVMASAEKVTRRWSTNRRAARPLGVSRRQTGVRAASSIL